MSDIMRGGTEHGYATTGKVKSRLVALTLCVLATSTAQVQAATYYFHNDHLGTPQAVTDENQIVVWQGVYGPFGEVEETVVEIEQNLRFPGQYLDRESGLHHNYFRDYDPVTGRYVQSDPIGLRGGLSIYGYGLQNPIKHVDPYGLEVLIQSHPVVSFTEVGRPTRHVAHAKVTIFPEPGSRFINSPALHDEPDRRGRRYLTIGAGPDSGVFGPIVGDINRVRDVDLSHNLYSQSVFEMSCPSLEAEDSLIEQLINAEAAFDDRKLQYDFFPSPFNQINYNSNSFVNGLLRSVGLYVKAPPVTWGFNKPIPAQHFK